MKKKFLFLFSIVLVCALCLFGCGGVKLSGGPKASDTVYGNGGMAVVKGDYLYFANAYIDYNNIGRYENKYNDDKSKEIYGIYRTKLNDFGIIELNEDGTPKGAELLVPQVGGYAYSGLYICGDYLYYTSPFTGDNKGTEVKGLVTFDRVKLDGTGHEVLHTMNTYSSSCKYFINYIDKATVITILDDSSNLQLIKISGGSKQIYNGDKNELFVEGVTSVATMKQADLKYNESLASVNMYAYYTQKDSSNYYTLVRKSLLNPTLPEEILIPATLDEMSVVSVENNRVYYLRNNILMSSDFNAEENSKVYTTMTIDDEATTGIVSYKILQDTQGAALDRGVIVVINDGSNYIVANVNGVSQEAEYFSNSKQITVLYADGNDIYYKVAEDEALCVYNISSKTTKTLATKFNTSVTEEITNVYDFDQNRAYYFSTVENSNGKLQYLHMVGLNGFGFKNAEGSAIGKYIGKLDSSDIK